MRGCASGRAWYVVRGVCVLVVRVAFQCVYLCLRACACLMLRRGVVAVRIWPESCWSMGCERMGVLFGLFWVLLMPLFAHDLRFCRSVRGRVRTGVCAMGLAWV